MMTRQDFVAIADVLYRIARPDETELSMHHSRYRFLVQEMASVCAESNRHFDKEKFFEACGLELVK